MVGPGDDPWQTSGGISHSRFASARRRTEERSASPASRKTVHSAIGSAPSDL